MARKKIAEFPVERFQRLYSAQAAFQAAVSKWAANETADNVREVVRIGDRYLSLARDHGATVMQTPKGSKVYEASPKHLEALARVVEKFRSRASQLSRSSGKPRANLARKTPKK